MFMSMIYCVLAVLVQLVYSDVNIGPSKKTSILTDTLQRELRGLNNRACANGMFSCDQGRCIRTEYVCDTEHDCFDGTDESVDACVNRVCGKEEYFRCKDARCVPLKWRCDGETDCPDGSDETDCGWNSRDNAHVATSNLERDAGCDVGKKRCEGSYCIPADYICDGAFDCPGHDDEEDCDK